MCPDAGLPGVEVGVASRARKGHTDSGDLYAIQHRNHGVLIAVVDGLGHGNDARKAAREAVATIEDGPEEAVIPLMKRCHARLRRTRGAAISLAEIDYRDHTLTWVAVGNVEGVLFRQNPGARPPSESIIQRGGVVGDRLPPLQSSTVRLSPGDVLVMATDGISEGFRVDVGVKRRPQELADRLCERFSRAEDDALVLVAQYSGFAP
jgi:serine phosphatase RsbU (regulator of sigma subunit)